MDVSTKEPSKKFDIDKIPLTSKNLQKTLDKSSWANNADTARIQIMRYLFPEEAKKLEARDMSDPLTKYNSVFLSDTKELEAKGQISELVAIRKGLDKQLMNLYSEKEIAKPQNIHMHQQQKIEEDD